MLLILFRVNVYQASFVMSINHIGLCSIDSGVWIFYTVTLIWNNLLLEVLHEPLP